MAKEGLNIPSPASGLNTSLPDNLINPDNAAKSSENAIYEYGVIKSPFGFGNLDMTDTGLNSNDPILSVFSFKEQDGFGQAIAYTVDKIFVHDRVNNDWDEVQQTVWNPSSNVDTPVSHIEMRHDDSTIYLNDNTTQSQSFLHSVVSDGGLSDIQRWSGRNESTYLDLLGGGDYHDGTTHRAKQVATFRSRIILISPLAFSSGSGVWIENLQRVRWSAVGKAEQWTGTGTGFSDLNETGGANIAASNLGNQLIIYQDKGIWSLNYVGGTTVFDPKPQIYDLGLLAQRLLVTKNNVDYFVGSDYNVYSYFGGTAKENIGDKIQTSLGADLSTANLRRSIIAMEPRNKRLWIFIVVEGDTYIRKAYVRNMRTGVWSIRDFTDYYTDAAEGITAADIVGSFAFTTGTSYSESLDTPSLFKADPSQQTASDVTVRFGDRLLDVSRALTKDFSTGSWSAGGLDYSLAAGTFDADITEGDMLAILDGSNGTNAKYGRNYYHVFDVTNSGYSVQPTAFSSGGDTGIADNSTNIPVILDGTNIEFYNPSGATYSEVVQDVLGSDMLTIGDSSGYVYQFDTTIFTQELGNISVRHVTPQFDLDNPRLKKRWNGVSISAKGVSVMISYRIDNFDTSEDSWIDMTLDLTDTFTDHDIFTNRTSEIIQYKFSDISGDYFEIRSFEILPPMIMDNR